MQQSIYLCFSIQMDTEILPVHYGQISWPPVIYEYNVGCHDVRYRIHKIYEAAVFFPAGKEFNFFPLLQYREHSNTNKLHPNKPTSLEERERKKKNREMESLTNVQQLSRIYCKNIRLEGRFAERKHARRKKIATGGLIGHEGLVGLKWVLMEHPRRDNDAERRPASICTRTRRARERPLSPFPRRHFFFFFGKFNGKCLLIFAPATKCFGQYKSLQIQTRNIFEKVITQMVASAF